MTVTHGQLARDDRYWYMRAVPHVAQRAKRLFTRAFQDVPGVIMVSDNPETARDLEWFLSRYPLALKDADRAYLTRQSDAHRRTEQAVSDILGGYLPPLTWQEPACKPRDYQLLADALAHATGRVLLADDLGLGKTFTALLRLRDPAALPALVTVPAHLPAQWADEIAAKLPWLRVHITATTRAYDPATRRGSDGQQPDVLITTYSKLPGWTEFAAGRVKTVIFDEAHELRTGQGTAKWNAARHVAAQADYRIELSATPVHGYGEEIWNVVEIIAPGVLGTRDEFLREWCSDTATAGRHRKVRNPAMLGAWLRDQGILLARTRKQVHMELPEPIEIEQAVATDHATIDQVAADVADQARLIITGGGTWRDRGQAALDLDWRLRAATGLAKAPYVAEFVKLLLESEERVVLWGWHRAVYDIWTDRLAAYNPVLYTGSESAARKRASAEAFCGGDARVLIMSLRSGAGLDGLQQHCSAGVFGELDWSPEAHRQCIGRLARDGQPATVVAYYMTSDDGTDPLMCDVLGVKKSQARPIRDPDTPLFTALTPDTDRARHLAADVLNRVSRRTKGPR